MFFQAGLWSFVGKFGYQVSNFIILMVLARTLSPEDFGIVAGTQIIIVLSEVVVRFGLGAALIQTGVIDSHMERSVQSIMLFLATVLAVFLLLVSKPLADVLKIPEMVNILPIMLITFIFLAASNISTSLISRNMDFRYLALCEIISLIVGYGVVAICLSLLGFTYWSLVYGALTKAVIYFFLMMRKKPVLPTLEIKFYKVWPLIHFGGGVFVGQLMTKFAQKIDNLVVTSTLGPTSLGFYSRAFNVMELSNNLLGTAFKETLFAGFSKEKRENIDVSDRSRTFLISHSLSALIILPITAILYLLADEIIQIAFGSQWEATVPILRILSLGIFFRLGYKVSHSFNLADGKVYQTALFSTFYSIIVFFASIIGVKFGLVGIAYGVLISLGLYYLVITSLSISLIKVTWWMLIKMYLPFISAFLISFFCGDFFIFRLRTSEFNSMLVLFVGALLITFIYLIILMLLRKTESIKMLEMCWSNVKKDKYGKGGRVA